MPRSEAAYQQIKDERREQIQRAARSVFARKGLAATKIADIAASAGVSHGLVYHYFPSKEDLFTAIVRQAAVGGGRLLEEVLAEPGTPLDHLRVLYARMIEGAREDPEFLLLSLQALTSEAVPDEARATLTRFGEGMVHELRRLIRRGQEAGQVVAGDPAALASYLLAVVQGLTLQRVTRPGDPLPSSEAVLRTLTG